MTCAAAQAALSALLDGELADREHAEVEAHARECEACARRLARLQAAQALARSAAPDWSQPHPSRPSFIAASSMAAAVAVPLVLILAVAFNIGPVPLLPLPPHVERRPPPLNLRSAPMHSDAVSARDCRISGSDAECTTVADPVACESIDECGPPPVVVDFP